MPLVIDDAAYNRRCDIGEARLAGISDGDRENSSHLVRNLSLAGAVVKPDGVKSQAKSKCDAYRI